MSYNEVIKKINEGHEFEGTLDGKIFHIIQLRKGTAFVLDEGETRFQWWEEDKCLYKGKTFKQLFDEKILELEQMY